MGFKFSGTALVWAKRNKKGTGWFMSTGCGTRKNAEVCRLGRRGSPQRKSKGVRKLIVAPLREHSQKPDEVYRRIEALCDGPYVELFARQQWPNWTCVGDEVGKLPSAKLPSSELPTCFDCSNRTSRARC
jgi:N6-adenosine-specific RNA methylase IME4